LQTETVALCGFRRRKDKPMEITYTQHGDYLLPDIALSDPPDAPPLGRYGRMRRTFLREHRPILYNRLLLTETLYPHLRETDEAANRRMAIAPSERRLEAEEAVMAELVYS
jgi:hypothetical protein